MTTPWWAPFDEAAKTHRRHREDAAMSELTFALEGVPWSDRREVVDDCEA